METLIMHPESKEQLTALKAFAKALKVKFETERNQYSAEFVAKIEESERQIKEGNFTILDPKKTIWENIK